MIEKDFLILVDQKDTAWGKLEKELVHKVGLLHRAFSVFLFNPNGEMLLQQRADSKYHSGGLWTNSCCSHPRYGEELNDAVERRLMEEMGINCPVQYAFHFHYNEKLENGLIENEFDHVFIGTTDLIPRANISEVKNWKYQSIDSIREDINANPLLFTVWFKIIFEKVAAYYKTLN